MTDTASLSQPHLSQTSAGRRRYHIGAEATGDGVDFRVWAPDHSRVEVVLEDDPSAPPIALAPEEGGYFSGRSTAARVGSRYRYRLDGGNQRYADPASRFQPDGPFGPSEVVDPTAFAWTDERWRGVTLPRQVIYEIHPGTFTEQGTWRAAVDKLPHLAELGVTVIELMPVAAFPGRFGWGYDGVNMFAPSQLYGRPDDLRAFVDRAHALGIAVILDVVYNHFGPSGCVMPSFASAYFTDRYQTDWGSAINYDGPGSEGVRAFVTANAAYWIDEFHMDGLRADATQSIFDSSPEHIMTAIAVSARRAAGERDVLLVAENEPQDSWLVRPVDRGGFGYDALWNDDFHHSAMVALTGRREAYYSDYRGTPQELLSAMKWGFLYQGQYHSWQKKARGRPSLDVPSSKFITFIQNHDQIANPARGLRCHQLTSPGRHRALTALLLLSPPTPMFFQGQDFNASAPFLFFADHEGDLADVVRTGRAAFMSQYISPTDQAAQQQLPDPESPETFTRCRLDWSERETNAAALALHQDLLTLRRDDPTFRDPRPRGLDGAVLGERALLLRFFGASDGDASRVNDRLLLLNLGEDLSLPSVADPLLAPPEGCDWTVLWSSEDPKYGGNGTPPLRAGGPWLVPGGTTLVLTPEPSSRQA